MKPTSPHVNGRRLGFSLVELLVVIAIIGVLAGFGVPALRGIGQSNAINAGIRQLTDDLSLARLHAITERTTVYVVFVPSLNRNYLTDLNEDEKRQFTNLLTGQYSAYNFLTLRSLGDQPGQGYARYITDWKYLPDGVFVDTNKFDASIFKASTADPVRLQLMAGASVTNRPFFYSDTLPFPAATSPKGRLLPYIAFNYQGQLIHGAAAGDEIIRLVKGSLFNERDAKGALIVQPAEVIATPKGNSANNPHIRIDGLTGRVRVVVNTPGT